jgi:hypothetical protein
LKKKEQGDHLFPPVLEDKQLKEIELNQGSLPPEELFDQSLLEIMK